MATNPYLQDQANAITQQATQNLNTNILPGINAGAMAAGGYGGSRQGIAQGLAIGQTNQGITNSLAGLYGNAYEGDQNRANQAAMNAASLANQSSIASMQNQTARDLGFGNLALGNKQADNSYGLGLGNLGLGYTQASNNYNLGLGQLGLGNKQADQNFYTAQRGQDLSQLGLGAQLAGMGNTGLYNQGQQLYQTGQTQQQAPYNALGQYAGLLSPFTGLNQSQSQSTPGPSTAGSALGGALTAAQIYKLLFGG